MLKKKIKYKRRNYYDTNENFIGLRIYAYLNLRILVDDDGKVKYEYDITKKDSLRAVNP